MGHRTLTGIATKLIAVVGVGVGATLLARRKRGGTQPNHSATGPENLTTAPTQPERTYSQDDIALRAYFISERRRRAGLNPDPHQDWLEAEQELQADVSSHPSASREH